MPDVCRTAVVPRRALTQSFIAKANPTSVPTSGSTLHATKLALGFMYTYTNPRINDTSVALQSIPRFNLLARKFEGRLELLRHVILSIMACTIFNPFPSWNASLVSTVSSSPNVRVSTRYEPSLGAPEKLAASRYGQGGWSCSLYLFYGWELESIPGIVDHKHSHVQPVPTNGAELLCGALEVAVASEEDCPSWLHSAGSLLWLG